MKNTRMLPISEYQNRFFLEWALLPEESTYNILFVHKINGNLNRHIFKKACEYFIKQHEIFHARYNEDGSQCYYCDYEINDFYNEHTLDLQDSMYSQIRKITDQPFDLTKDVLLRLYLLNSNNSDEYYFVVNLHHIIVDANTGLTITKDISNNYNQLIMDPTWQFNNIEHTFSKAVEAGKYALTEKYKHAARDFWLEFISDIPVNIPLPYKSGVDTKQLSSHLADKSGEFIYFELDEDTTKLLKEYSYKTQSTLFIVLAAIYGVILSKYSNQKKILLSYPVDMRPKAYSQVTGCFVNNVPLKIELDESITLTDLITAIKQQRMQVRNHQQYSLTNIIDDLRNIADVRLDKYFNVGFVQANLNAVSLDLTNLNTQNVDISSSQNEIYELALFYDKYSDSIIKFRLGYRKQLFDELLIKQFIQSFKNLINESITQENVNLQSYCVLDKTLYQQLIYQWNQTVVVYPENKTIHQLFEEQVNKTPGNIAMVHEDIQLSYQELNQKANQLAHYLRETYSIYADDLIALYLDRSQQMLIALLGVLKSGAAYVPLDPTYPEERISYILQDSKAKILLTNAICYSSCGSYMYMSDGHQYSDTLILDGPGVRKKLANQLTSNPQINITSSNLAYVIYTSGTTGTPKGVMIEHRSYLNAIQAIKSNYFKSNRGITTYSLTEYVFDIFGLEYGLPLLSGGSITLGKNDFVSLDLSQYSFVQMTPSLLSIKLNNLINTSSNTLLIGGEALSNDLLEQSVNAGINLINVYGPTETTIWSTAKLYVSNDVNHLKISNVSIGKPLANETCYILDANLTPLPIGAIGELYIGGSGLASGYLNLPELTAERFIANPFQSLEEKQLGKNSRLYKTGDLVRYLADGNIEYIGRNDFQVKIRGFRIEPGEIEKSLTSINGIIQASVITKQKIINSETVSYLVGYYVLDKGITAGYNREILDDWEQVYDSEYTDTGQIEDFKNDFRLWNSFITSSKISGAEMEEWRNAAVSQIERFNPENILDIGVGSGLIMYPLLNKVKKYVGIDISNEAISRHCRILKNNPSVELFHLTADKINEIKHTTKYDCIIINSVCQYFPDATYLNDVINKSIDLLNDQGRIFIGDVRNLTLLKDLVLDRLKYQNMPCDKDEVNNYILKENELLIAPQFFLNISTNNPHLKVDILEKLGNYCNELSKYRYDVVITKIESNSIQTLAPIEKTFEMLPELGMICSLLKVDIQSILIHKIDNTRTLNKIIRYDDYVSACKQYGYLTKVFHYCKSDDRYSSLLISKQEIYLTDIFTFKNFNHNIFNIPFRNKLTNHKILSILERMLPKYMIPDWLIEMENFPLTINGKLDRKALPEVEFKSSNNYVAPGNELEAQVCRIYAEVLGLDISVVGINDDFFRLGGNSILAIKLASSLNKVLSIKVKVASLFKYKTIHNLLNSVLSNDNEVIAIPRLILSQNELADGVSLSFVQERLWFIEQFEEGSYAYNIPLLSRLAATVELDILEQAIHQVIARHRVLHSVIKTNAQGNGCQVIRDLAQHPVKINKLQLESEEELSGLLKAEVNHVFKLDNEYLVRATIAQLNGEYYLIIVVHHIAFDGWSIDVLFKDLEAYYNKQELPELAIQYSDFAVWQRGYLQGLQLEQQLSYWKSRLAGYEGLNLPIDKPRPQQISYAGDDLYFILDKELSNKLRDLAKELEVSLYSLLLSGFNLFLGSYSNQDDIIIGTPIANRHYEQLENLIGFFVNTLALRSSIDRNTSLSNYIMQINKEVIEAQLHQDLPLVKLVEELNVPQDVSRHPIFQVMFGVQNFGAPIKDSVFERINAEIEQHYKIAKFDLTVMIDDSEEQLRGTFNYATSLYNHETIEAMLSTYKHILNQMVTVNDINYFKLSELSYLNSVDYTKLIYTWNQTAKAYPEDKTIHELFEDQVSKTPDNIAVVYEDIQLSYQELNQRANQLAHYLRSTYHIYGDDLIALCLDRSEQMLIAILGVLKSGGAYVPLDPTYPEELTGYILADTQAKAVITNKVYSSHESWQFFNILAIDSDTVQYELDQQLISNPEITITSNNLAYVIYTSGTTGKPKGVMIEHNGVINSICSLIITRKITSDSIICQSASFVFDSSVAEMFTALISGASVHILRADYRKDLQNIINYIQIRRITHLFLTSKLGELFIELPFQLKHNLILIIAGEQFTYNGKISKPNLTIINEYGPTEATICSLVNHYLADINGSIIGKLVLNTSAYILDTYLTPLPIGAIGELYIGGAGVASGYLNLPELTAERFITNPFQSEEEKQCGKNDRLYKTGDLVRYLPDGNIEYIGRNDFQVKIRGFRIETGEIESKLNNYPGIRQSLVVAKEHHAALASGSSNKYLVGYYVSDIQLDEGSIFDYLNEYLPDYMVPSVLFHMENFPLTLNGKLDRKALPEIEFKLSNNYTAPSNELEAKVCLIYAEVLGLDASVVGINDDFFRLGGNSILAIKLASSLNKVLSIKVKVASLFKHKTIHNLLNAVLSNDDEIISIPKLILSPEGLSNGISLSFAQERIWFIEQFEEGSHAYNIPLLSKLAATVKLDILEQSIHQVIARHRVLHSVIKTNAQGNGCQVICDLAQHPVKINKLQLESEEELSGLLKAEVNHVFKLDNEYPVRTTIVQLNEVSYLIMVVHHIAFDGWSIDILFKDLEAYYNKQELPELAIQYSDFAVWQRGYLQGLQLEQQLSYWKSRLAGYEGLNLPIDKPRPQQISYAGEDAYFTLDKDLSNRLRDLAKELEVSLYSLLLSGFNLFLGSYSNQDDIIVGTPIANRHYEQLENLIGLFVNTLALRSSINRKTSLSNYIMQINKEVIEAQLHQDLPFVKLVEELNVPKDVSRHPIFQVMFGVQSFGLQVEDSIFDRINAEIEQYYKIAKFDLTVMIDDSEEQLRGTFNYATSLYNHETIEAMLSTYKHILNQMITISDINYFKLSELSYLNSADYTKLIYTWNQTAKAYPEDKTLHELFEDQVSKTPDNIAVVYEDIQLSYQELNQRANQLAHYLRSTYHIYGDDLIALCLDRSEQMLIAILGVLKSGGAYVPLDPTYPEERTGYILTDTQAKVIITNNIYDSHERWSLSLNILAIDSETIQAELSRQPKLNPGITITSSNLAYVIYTSGTTGKPKGVMIEHQSVMNTILAMNEIYSLSPNSKVTEFAAYIFDVSVSEIFITLFNGGELHLLNETIRHDPILLSNYIASKQINVSFLPPLILSGINRENYPELKRLIYAGDVCDIETGKYWSQQALLYNYYGPTEVSIYCLGKMVQRGDVHLIGKPISNTSAYILDDRLTPLPIGAIGELCIGGAGLASGYLNLPELTAGRFIANPFQSLEEKQLGKNSRLYKTGDMVRYLPDGNIEYIGRNDFQVKIRGFRIETGEIESKLNSYPGIKQSVVVAKEQHALLANGSSNKYLVGYYVAEIQLDEGSIFDYLNECLPDYMVPSVLFHMENLPLTLTGKLDRNALAEVEFKPSDNYLAPGNELEAKICRIYAEVLGLDVSVVGINDDFFRLGGDSIVSIQLVSRLRQRLGLTISIRDVFNYKSVARLYEQVIAKQQFAGEQATILHEAGELSGSLESLPIQEWFFAGITEGSLCNPGHWNQSFLIRVPPLDVDVLKVSILKLISYHDSFRMGYCLGEDGKYRQFYRSLNECADIGIKCLDRSLLFDTEYQEQLTHWQSKYNLTNESPLYSIGYISGFADGSSRIFFALHHLLVDAVSWRIISHDLERLYNRILLAKESDNLSYESLLSPEELLGQKGTSYRQWIGLVKDYAKGNSAEVSYWQDQLTGLAANQEFWDKLEVEESNYTEISLDQKITRELLTQSNQAYHTEINDLLLSAFGLALAKFSITPVNYITLEGHGREEINSNQNVTRTVGWFTTMYPICLDVDKNSLSTTIINIKEQLRSIPNKGIGYGALFSYDQDLPRISFNYLGQFATNRDTNWSIVSEASGISIGANNHDRNIINVNGMVSNGELKFGLSARLAKEHLTALAAEFKQQLCLLVGHTMDQEQSYLTGSDIGQIISQKHLDMLQAYSEIEQVYLANSLQQGFIYHDLNQGDKDTAYRVQLIFEYNNELNPELLKSAWQGAIKRYPSLRLRFAWEEELVQIVDKHQDIYWNYTDLISLTKKEQQSQLDQVISEDRQKGYNLAQGNLLRIYLFKQAGNKYTCLMSSHHAILDGWSNPRLLGFVHELYLQLQESPDKTRLIMDSIRSEESYVNSQHYLQENIDAAGAYWTQQLSRIEEYADLKGILRDDKRDIQLGNYRLIKDRQENQLIISGEDYTNLKQLSQIHGVTLNAILQYVWHKVLSVYGNTRTTIVGTTISGRSLPIDGVEESVGLYINTLPLIVEHDVQQSILIGLEQIQVSINELNIHGNISLAKLHNNGQRLFDSLFVFENYPTPKKSDNYPIKLSFKASIEELDYPLAVAVYENNQQLVLNLKYAGELFSEESIKRLLNTFKVILEDLSLNLDLERKQIHNYLDKDSYEQLIYTWNQTAKAYPEDKTLHELFEDQVSKTPDNIAVVYEDIQLSYQELNQRANQLAHYLRGTYHIYGDDLIALCLDRSEQMLIAILGVLKSGGAYVPLDPTYPEERTGYILADTQAKAVITNKVYSSHESWQFFNILAIDSDTVQYELDQQPKSNPGITITSSNLAYVIYTSGTTGKPKGVMVEHKGVVNLIVMQAEELGLGEHNIKNLNFLLYASYVFDAYVWELFAVISSGYSIHIINNVIRQDIYRLSEYIKEQNISIATIPPVLLDKDNILSLSTIIVAGDITNKGVLENYDKNGINIINAYGPTEATVCATLNHYKINDNYRNIGKPISNTSAYILDDRLTPLPIGAIGELCIGGAGLASGYLNLPELTAGRFIANPFQSLEEKQLGKNSRLYKTGDMVRYLPDGNIEYIGRNDFQVKIRGFRIETGEIESKLNSYPGIKQSVVVAKEQHALLANGSSNKYLVGYYVAEIQLDEGSIFDYLNECLPDYMVPSVLFHMENLPLTLTGKLDRNALAEVEFKPSDNYLAPGNELEAKICRIYAEVLGLDVSVVGINDDFFRLGGDSIVSIQLVSRLRQRLGLTISIRDVFNYKSVARLYEQVIAKQQFAGEQATILHEAGELSGSLESLPIQEWFFAGITEGSLCNPGHWNQSFLIRVPPLDVDVLKVSILKLISYHDSFRMGYCLGEDGKYRQFYRSLNECADIGIKCLDRSLLFDTEYQEQLTHWQSKYNLTNESPLYSIGYISGFADGSSRIFFALHHLLVDAVSWRIISHDLERLYNRILLAKESDNLSYESLLSPEELLGQKGTSYRQWIGLVKDYAKGNSAEVSYWQDQLTGLAANQEFWDKLEVEESNYTEISLDQKITRELLTQSNQAYHTEINDLLLSAFGLALAKFSITPVNYITLEGHGREEINSNQNVTRTVGWFTTMYPICLDVDKNSLSTTIINIKEQLRSIPNKGIGYGALFSYDQDLPRISFNYLGQFATNRDTNWSIVSEASGISIGANNHDRNIINVNGMVSNGELKFGLSARLAKEHLTALAAEFKQQLCLLVGHTMDQEQSYLTGSDIGQIISQKHLDMLQAYSEIEQVYLANSLQQGFIYHDLNQGDKDTAYRVQLIFEYNNELNPELLKSAWQGAIKRYPSLRLRFAWEEELVQIVDKHQDIYWNYTDLISLTKKEQQSQLDQVISEDRQKGYNLAQGNLLRIYLFKQAGNKYTCLMSSHHAILDGWSNPRLLGFVHELYLQLQESPDKTRLIMDSIRSEESYVNSQHYLQENIDAAGAYWTQQLSRIEEYADLKGILRDDKRDIQLGNYRLIKDRQENQLIISGEDYTNLKQLSQIHGVTLNAILQYVWHKVLSVYGNTRTTIVGTTISGRSLPIDGVEESVGLYINTLPLIVEHDVQQSILIGLEQIQVSINELNIHGNISLAKLHNNGQRLFDSLFVFENYPTPKKSDNYPIKLSFKASIEELDYPLAVAVYENNQQLVLNLKYAGELFSEESIKRLLNTFKVILEDLSLNLDLERKQIHNYLDKDSYEQLIYTWNQTAKAYPEDKTLHELFEDQVSKTPDNIAVVYEDIQLSYQELNQRANQLAHYLRGTYHIYGDDLIALCLDRSEQMLIAILGVLKSGGAYVPLDPTYPEERTGYILADTQAKAVITNKVYSSHESWQFFNILAIDSDTVQYELDQQPKSNPGITITSSNLAYVIYTSGTTGKPKGVMVEHKGVVNLIVMQAEELGLGEHNIKNLNFLLYASYVFDAYVWELFAVISSGYSIHIINNVIRQDIYRLSEYIKEQNISIATIPPVLLDKDNILSLSTIIVAGDITNKGVLENYDKNGINIINAYGPTEATVCATLNHYKINDNYRNIGKPISNTSAYILDDRLTPLPIGAIGELCIGGAGLASGYLNLPELTAGRFIANPFQSLEEKQLGKNSRLYKTGDMVRYLPDGNIEYIGRNDFQVKIRGFRIETGEIESKLNSYPGIKQSVVVAKEQHALLANGSSNKYLVGYYVAEIQLDEGSIFDYLNECLPDYMVPSVLFHMENLPLTLTGKLDRNALAEVEFKPSDNYLAPGNELEAKICRIYAEVLGLDVSVVGINDDFFRLGGDSILAIKLVNVLNKEFNTQLQIAEIFANIKVKLVTKLLYQTNGKYQTLVKLNTAGTNKPFMFMVHPGESGCEVYLTLANQLNNYYNCYGVDSYNLYNKPKIDNLNKLANYYLEYIKHMMQENSQEEYYFLGWSLGGQIALEMCAILEQEGNTKVKVFLLDTIMPNKQIRQLRQKIGISQAKLNKQKQMINYDESYVNNVIENFEVEWCLASQDLSNKLIKTQCTLFKAMQFDNKFIYTEEIYKYNFHSVNNNIDMNHVMAKNITTINVNEAHHGNILDYVTKLFEHVI